MSPIPQTSFLVGTFFAVSYSKPALAFNAFLIKIVFYFFRCGCDECMTSRSEDSLRHSRSRINAYRALASPSLIALSSKDPILTAFELSWELRRLSFAEHEFKSEYLVSTFCRSKQLKVHSHLKFNVRN